MTRMVECVPNFSEGRNAAVVDEIMAAISRVGGAVVLDRHMDSDHHRSVVTFVSPLDAAVEAATAGVEKAAELIDLNRHEGAHPRIGAADVVAFVPLEGVAIGDCVELAWRTGDEIWRRCRIPVYFYGAAARIASRDRLESIRKGQFELLRRMVREDPTRQPDIGAAELHPTAGATAVGARKFLIAFNVNLATADLSAAQRIARKVRASSGGLPFIKAMGVFLKSRNLAQVSMNLTDFDQTPLQVAFEAVQREAQNGGIGIASSEIVGLVPSRALDLSLVKFLKLENFDASCILENRMAARMALSPKTSPATKFSE